MDNTSASFLRANCVLVLNDIMNVIYIYLFYFHVITIIFCCEVLHIYDFFTNVIRFIFETFLFLIHIKTLFLFCGVVSKGFCHVESLLTVVSYVTPWG